VDENKRHQLLTIQAIIARMGVNSFLLKGWSVTLISALFALAATKANESFVAIALMPCIVFWGLDGYFLWQERLFRALYNHARTLDEQSVDFSLDTHNITPPAPTLGHAIFSQTVLIFHGSLLVAIIVALAVSFWPTCPTKH
jgi:uncharacterized membrane protein